MKNFKRKISLLLSAIMIFSAMPIFAESIIEPVVEPVAESSKWASSEIVEAERYGIYPKEIYSDSLKNKLSKENMDTILNGLNEKIGTTKLVKNENFKAVEIGDNTTRGGFLKELYNSIAPYDKAENLGKDPIMYLNHINVAKGNGKQELYLNRNITTEEAIIFAKRSVDYLFNENNLGSKGLMWEINNKNNKVYLLGSIHMGDSSLYPFSDKVMERYNESDELYVEVDISDQEALQNIFIQFTEAETNAMKYTDGKTLKSVVGEETYGKIKELMTKYEIEESEYANIKPYGIISQLETFSLLDNLSKLETEEISEEELNKAMEEFTETFNYLIDGQKYGVDLFFLNKAKADEKAILELESAELQFQLLFSNPNKNLTESEQIAKLNETIENILNPKKVEKTETKEEVNSGLVEAGTEAIKAMLDSVKTGDAEKLAKVFSEQGGINTFGGNLVGERDKNMAKKIANLLESDANKTYFIVVGAAHYVTEGMTIDNLKAMGYDVKKLD